MSLPGGLAGTAGETWLIEEDAQPARLPNVVQVSLEPGQRIRGRDSAGGGYGDPLDREPERVLLDVLEGWESRQKALAIYGVVMSGDIDDETLTVDQRATTAKRAALRSTRAMGTS